MKYYIPHLFKVLPLLVFINVHGQDTTAVELTMEEVIQSALAANATIKMAELNQSIAHEEYKQSNAVYLPQADVKYTAFATNNPLNAFGFKLQQQSIAASDFNPALLNNPGNTNNFSTSFNLRQPLINIDKLMQRKGASSNVSSSEYVVQRTKEQIVFETQKAYIQLGLTYRVVNTLEEALLSAQNQETYVKNRFDKGLIQKADLLNVEIQVKNIENQLNEAKSNIRNSSDQLSILMGKPIGAIYRVNDAVILTPTTQIPITVSPERSDFKALAKAIESSSWMKKSIKTTFLPTVNAFGSYYMNDKTALGFNSNSYLIGVQVEWNILNGTRNRHAVQSANLLAQKMTIQLDQQKSQSQLMLNKTIREMEDLQGQSVKQAKAVEQAEEVFHQTSDRYKEGLALTNDLLSAQVQLLQQKLLLQQIDASRAILQAFIEFQTTTSN